MIDKSIIGKEYAPFTVEVEKRWVRSFAEAIGETNPVYFNESVARAGGYRSLPVPPTFPFAMIMDGNQSFMILDQLGIDKRRAMHGEQSFAYHADLCAGDVVTGRQRVVDVYDRKWRAGIPGHRDAAGKPARRARLDLRTTVVVRN